ncbi:hypothetical protein CALVIDRAFT_537497 [Calocera viscosa TUFC12733]|uniref:SURF1-like protein n=1 Tax=Calocera viscosa (strain TUFC12733) TaxID=1330018 RepID=A0A167LPP7_CALVF|nr:hypothetical protein CALVIDRAFT_537497 [Calocera viscosa TUFC12733]
MRPHHLPLRLRPPSPLARYAALRRPPPCRRIFFWHWHSPTPERQPLPTQQHWLLSSPVTITTGTSRSPVPSPSTSSSSSSSSSGSSYAPPPPPPPRKPTFTTRLRSSPAAALLGIIPLITLGLGFWQVYRLRWKLALIDELDDKLAREALWLPGRINVSKLPEFQYRRVLASGHYLSLLTVYVGPRTHEGTHGYHALTPLLRPGGSTILINRGFVAKDFCPGGAHYAESPLALEAAAAASAPAAAGLGPEVTVEGLLRIGTKRGTFTPDNDPQQGAWYWLDLPALALHAGGEEAGVQAVLVDEVFDGHAGLVSERLAKGVPFGRPARVELRNMHAVYAATWFSLAAATAAMFWALVTKGRVSGKGRKWRP